ncbi:hypothetical protein C2G38_2031862 [Gigaspora rosea]|uniref:Restriction endonuclease type IV Mrr domain-containing protein n=1 Tax=Gigaspora rosea TaxID=44941 RepID=A0A397VPN0_9GLOM|nr:hypothetical protein C2G38_2031862 [Gigaspora rosea]
MIHQGFRVFPDGKECNQILKQMETSNNNEWFSVELKDIGKYDLTDSLKEFKSASNHKIGHDFEFTIRQKLNLSNIIAKEVKVNQGDGGNDIIATYKNNLVLIQCKSIEKPIAVQTMRNFESSVSRFPNSLGIIVCDSTKIEDKKYLTIKASSWVKSSKFNLSVCNETSIISTIKNII